MKYNVFFKMVIVFFVSTIGMLIFILAKVSELEGDIKKLQSEGVVFDMKDSFEIEGKVLDGNNLPLAGAIILVDSLHRQVSNLGGEYNFKLPFTSDLISIIAEKDGFEKSTFSISVSKDKKINNDIFLMNSN